MVAFTTDLGLIATGSRLLPILEPAKHDLDPVASFVAGHVVFDRFLALLPSRDASAHAPLFHAHAGRCSVGLQVCGVGHHGLPFVVLRCQTGHNPGEDTLVAPPFPRVV